jgi:hypothetical protein
LIIDLNSGGHASRKSDARWNIINMNANWDALSQTHPGEDRIDAGKGAIVIT